MSYEKKFKRCFLKGKVDIEKLMRLFFGRKRFRLAKIEEIKEGKELFLVTVNKFRRWKLWDVVVVKWNENRQKYQLVRIYDIDSFLGKEESNWNPIFFKENYLKPFQEDDGDGESNMDITYGKPDFRFLMEIK